MHTFEAVLRSAKSGDLDRLDSLDDDRVSLDIGANAFVRCCASLFYDFQDMFQPGSHSISPQEPPELDWGAAEAASASLGRTSRRARG